MASDQDPSPNANLWSNYMGWIKRRNALDEQIVRKALDIPASDDMHIDQSRQYTGIGWRELAVLGAIAGATGLGVYGLTRGDGQPTPPVVQQPAQPVIDTDTDTGIVGIGRRAAE